MILFPALRTGSLWVLISLLVSVKVWSAAPNIEFKHHERVALVGNALAARMNFYGHFETALHLRYPLQELAVRNFAWPGDEAGKQQRPNDYTKIDDPLVVFAPDTFICFFGFNESFVGSAGVNSFKADLEKYINQTGQRFTKNGNRPRFILVSPIAFETTNDPLLPEGVQENANLKLYTAAISEVAKKLNLPFGDLFTPTAKLFSDKTGTQFTINGVHINDDGDRVIAEILDRDLLGSRTPLQWESAVPKKVRTAVNDKSWVHEQDYRMLNGWYVYGGRRTWDTETFPREYKKIRGMVATRDRYIWDIIQGKPTSEAPDDSDTGELIVPKTRFGVPQQSYSEPKELRYLSTDESIKAMTPASGFDVSLFASEEQFPELAKPVQIAFDNKGRLWVACMPTYPQWRPGDPKPNDRLLIFEDTDNDGRADKVKVFSDQLHCPTGFEFWNGGVLVVSQPRIMFLKDTDGDDKADVSIPWTDGWATDDSHHTVGAFEWSHGGLLHMLEGVSMSTSVETPWGPLHNQNTPGAYVVDPRTFKIKHFITPGYGNPWCYVFNWWGQGIVGDGTTAQQHWDSPLSGSQKGDRKGLNPVFDNQGMRPVIGSEFLYSRHFPDNVQGQFVYACVINMNGITRFNIHDEGAGYGGKRTDDLLKSTDRNFRPADPQSGPDGALWFGDWHNPLIGHMQYSQRDPNRDKVHGRIYRLTAKGRPLLKPVTQYGKSVPRLLDQLKEYEPRTRYRVRRELRDRPAQEVLAAITKWTAKLDKSDPNYDLYMTEALWVQQNLHAVDNDLLKEVLRAKTPEARAAATRVLADEWAYLPRNMELLRFQVTDEHPRVRLEAVRALSYVPTVQSAELVLAATHFPLDYYLDYTLQHTLGALEPIWKKAYQNGEFTKSNTEGQDYLKAYLSGRPQLGSAQQYLKTLVNSSDLKPADRQRALSGVAAARGKAQSGQQIFERICVACHKVGDKGTDYGPDLNKVGSRLKREELIESIIYPNAKVEPKWQTVNITTKGGQELSGVVASEDDNSVTLKLGAEQTQVVKKSDIAKRETLQNSNMPEGLGQTMSAEEFVDLVEFMATRK